MSPESSAIILAHWIKWSQAAAPAAEPKQPRPPAEGRTVPPPNPESTAESRRRVRLALTRLTNKQYRPPRLLFFHFLPRFSASSRLHFSHYLIFVKSGDLWSENAGRGGTEGDREPGPSGLEQRDLCASARPSRARRRAEDEGGQRRRGGGGGRLPGFGTCGCSLCPLPSPKNRHHINLALAEIRRIKLQSPPPPSNPPPKLNRGQH